MKLRRKMENVKGIGMREEEATSEFFLISPLIILMFARHLSVTVSDTYM